MRDADAERPFGCERSDAAEQVVVAFQRHEGGARRGDRAAAGHRVWAAGARRSAARRRWRRRRSSGSGARPLSRKAWSDIRDRRIADDPVTRAGGVTRRAAVEHDRPEDRGGGPPASAPRWGCVRTHRHVRGRPACPRGSPRPCARRGRSRRRGTRSGRGRSRSTSRVSGPPHTASSTAATSSGSCRTDDQRQHREGGKGALQEREVHFQAVLTHVGAVVDGDVRQHDDPVPQVGVDRDVTERRPQRVDARHGEPVERAHGGRARATTTRRTVSRAAASRA